MMRAVLGVAVLYCNAERGTGRPALLNVAAPVDESVCALTAPSPHHDPESLCCDACMHPYLLTTTRTATTVIATAGFKEWFTDYLRWDTISTISSPSPAEFEDRYGVYLPDPLSPLYPDQDEDEYAWRDLPIDSKKQAADNGIKREENGKQITDQLTPENAELIFPARQFQPKNFRVKNASEPAMVSAEEEAATRSGIKKKVFWAPGAIGTEWDMVILVVKQIKAAVEMYIEQSAVETSEICGRCISMSECADQGGRVEVWHHRCILP
jgi:hypothetical protein